MASASKQPQDDLELKQMTQAELARLERQYRVMEGDRSSYMSDMRVYLAQQRRIIDVLTKRKQNLMADTAVPVSKMVAKRESSLIHKIIKDLDLFESMSSRIKTESTQIRELKVQINKVKDEILKLNKTDVNELRVQEKKEEHKRMIVALEDRLEVATRKLNAVTADNAVYRGEINHLLYERKTFHRFYVQLSKQVMESKQVMLDLIEQATTAFDQREETQEKLKGLKERMKAERVLHAQEVRELVRKLENDEVLYEFLSVKGQKRVLADLEAKEAQQKLMEVEAIEEKVKRYNDMLDKIKQFSGETDIGRLAARFLKQEEENFTLFNYVNELNSELEALQEHVNELMLNIDEQRSINRERAAKEQETLTVLYGNLEREKGKVDVAERELAHLEGVLDDLMGGIERMFYRCRCDSAPVLALVGENPRVNIYNVMLCIAVLRKAVLCIVGEGEFELL